MADELSSASSTGRPVRLLLVDDNPHDRELLARALRQRFCSLSVEPARDAQELARALRYSTFDAAIVDYELGWSNGLEVFRQVRQLHQHCPVLMFTASGNEEVAVQAMKEGLADYITKTAKHYARLPFALAAALDRVAQNQALQLAESARTQLAGEVQVGHLRLQLALQAAGMMAWQHELGTDRVEVSINAEELVGTHWGSYPEVLAAIYEEDLPSFRSACERCREGEDFVCAVRILDPRSERPRWLEFRGQPLRDASGTITHVLGVALDVTARKRAEEEVQAAERRKDAFIATLAHELRNPLAPIRYATRLLAPGVPEDMAQDARKMIDRQLKHMARLLDDLLDVSRVTHGALHVRHDLIDLRDAIEVAIKTARPAAEHGKRNLTVRVPSSALPVRGDHERLVQMIGNLLSNAIKYTEPEGQIELEAGIDEADSQVVLRVRDDGIGIASETLPLIFDLFAKGDPGERRASGGLGIGLSLARDLIALHDGELEARSAGVGQGSEFTVRLPCSTETPVIDVEATVPQNVSILGASTLSVLVVDDNADAANALANVLNLAGFKTEVAYDPKTALEIATRVRPRIALLDIGLPALSGHELARQLRSLPGGNAMQLIAVTGWGQDADRRKSLEAGFDDHLTKPVDPHQLIGLISQRVRRAG